MATAKKTSSRKPAAVRPSRAKPRTSVAALPSARLPAGFVPEGFEMRGNEVRVWGQVNGKHHEASSVSAVIAKAPAPLQGYPEPPAPAPVRPSPLAEALHAHRMHIEDVYAALEGLESAASFVTIPQPPSPDGATGDQQGTRVVQSTALDIVQEQTRMLITLGGRIRYLTERIQS